MICYELEMRATVGGANQCSGGTPIASTAAATHPASNAFDGSSTTYWQSNTATGLVDPSLGTSWLGYQFASPVDVIELSFTSMTYTSNLWAAPTQIWLDYSDDGVNWSTLQNGGVTVAAWANNTKTTVIIDYTPTSRVVPPYYADGSTTTLNTGDTSSGALTPTFSAGNLEITGPGYSSGGACWARSTVGNAIGSGKFHIEATYIGAPYEYDPYGTENHDGIAVCDHTATPWSGVGNNAHLAVFNPFFGKVLDGNNGALTNSPTYPPYATGSNVSMDIDLINKKIWVSIDGDYYNGSSSADPASNVGGISIPSLIVSSGTVYIGAFVSGRSTNSLKVNLGGTNFAMPVPSGFTAGWTAAPPGVPINLVAQSTTYSTIYAVWAVNPAGGIPSTYTLQYRVNGTIPWTQITGINNTYVTITGLLPNTLYDMQIDATNAQGTSAFSATAEGLTQAPLYGAIPTFPTIPESFPVKVTPVFDTVLGTMKSLREMRVAQRQVSLWEFEIPFEEMRDQTQNQTAYTPFSGLTQYQQLCQTFMSAYGQGGIFLFNAPWDNSRTNQTIGIGDGSTYVFTIYRQWGISPSALNEPIGFINTVTNVKVNGVTVSSSQYYAQANKLYFIDTGGGTHPPAANATITMSFGFYYLCSFVEDEQDFEEFAKNRWTANVKLRTVYWP